MKEYDVYLKDRLTEGELILSSLPFRKLTSGESAMILDIALGYFYLQKMISVYTETELDAKIDRMIRILYTKIENAASIHAEADMVVDYLVGTEGGHLGISTAEMEMLVQRFCQVQDRMGITADPVELGLKYYMGGTSSEFAIKAACEAMVRRMAACINHDVGLDAVLDGTEKQDFLTVEHRSGIVVEVDDLLYHYTVGAEHAFAIAAAVTGTEIKHPLGSGHSEMEITVSDADTDAEKYLIIRQAVGLYMDWSDTLLKWFDGGIAANIAASVVGTALRRMRKLKEMDENALSGYDGMTLDDVDYITLEG